MTVLQKIPTKKLMKFMRFWPPYLASGIKVDAINEDFTKIQVSMKQYPWNTNYVGVHFGGSLYSMSDPFYMFILLEHLKKDFIVWDKEAKIKFIKPGKGKVRINFEIELSRISEIKSEAIEKGKAEPEFETYIYDEKDQVIAHVWKKLYVRKK